jgi:hypothetical protein
VDYAVQVELERHEGTPELDELQCHGVGALLSAGFRSIDGAKGPDGAEVDVLDFPRGPSAWIRRCESDAIGHETGRGALRAGMMGVLQASSNQRGKKAGRKCVAT